MGNALGIPVLKHTNKKPGGDISGPELAAFLG